MSLSQTEKECLKSVLEKDIPHQCQGQKRPDDLDLWVKVIRPLWVAVHVTTCRRWGHIVAAALQATQLVNLSFEKRPTVIVCESSY